MDSFADVAIRKELGYISKYIYICIYIYIILFIYIIQIHIPYMGPGPAAARRAVPRPM